MKKITVGLIFCFAIFNVSFATSSSDKNLCSAQVESIIVHANTGSDQKKYPMSVVCKYSGSNVHVHKVERVETRSSSNWKVDGGIKVCDPSGQLSNCPYRYNK